MTDDTDHSYIIIPILHLKEPTSASAAEQIEAASGSADQLQVCFLVFKLCRVISYFVKNIKPFLAYLSLFIFYSYVYILYFLWAIYLILFFPFYLGL